MQNFQALGALLPDPRAGYAPATLCTVYNHMGFHSFGFEQFFLRRSVANLMMLTRCMLNCFLFERFYLHYSMYDFDSIFLHCTKLFIRQSIHREQIFDVTFEPPPLKNPAYTTESAAYPTTISTRSFILRCSLHCILQSVFARARLVGFNCDVT